MSYADLSDVVAPARLATLDAAPDLMAVDPADLMTIYMHEVASHSILDGAEERALHQLATSDDPRAPLAREAFLRFNQRLVINMAAKTRRGGMPLEDRLSAANVGLMESFDKWEPARGWKFSTYATWWIRHHIHREVDNHGRTVRMTVGHGERFRSMIKVERDLEQRLQRAPSDEETAAEMRETIPALRDRQSAWGGAEVRQLKADFHEIKSLDAPIKSAPNDGDPLTLGDVLHGETPPVWNGITHEQVRLGLQNVMECLTPREQNILSLRFGLKGGEEMTLEQIGRRYGITRERIRQIEKEALAKLRHPVRARKLRPLVEAL